MLLPKGGVTWKSAKAGLPPWRAVLFLVTRTRFLVSVALTGLMILFWRGISSSASEMQRYGALFFLSYQAPGHVSLRPRDCESARFAIPGETYVELG